MASSKVKNITKSYTRYKNSTEEPIGIKEYVMLNNLYNKFMIAKALSGHKITLPNRMGFLQVYGTKAVVKFDEDGSIKNLSISWVNTKKLWDTNPDAKERKQLVYHTNPHTDGYRYKWLWSQFNVLVPYKSLYTLKLTRENKRLLHKKIMEGVEYKTR